MMEAASAGVRFAIILLVLALLSGCQTISDRPSPSEDDRSLDDKIEVKDEAMSAELPTYSAEPYFELVKKYADSDGNVDYEAWKASPHDLAALDEQVALLAAVSPENAPEQFPSRSAQRGYWINTYNTLVLHGVLEYWPLESVQDVKISLSSRIVPKKGFFYDRKAIVGGRKTNLYNLEKEVLKNQKDPRLHFAFNCASSSCPVLRPWEWTDEQLDQAGRDFVNSPDNVRVEGNEVYLSSIFKWYRKDFPEDILSYLDLFAEPALQAQLRAARDGRYRINHLKYDWAVNDS